MQLTPLKIKNQPDYPLFTETVDNPELLSKNVPFRWLANKHAAASLSAFVLFGNHEAEAQQTDKIEIVENLLSSPIDIVEKNNQGPVKVAPVFVHGDGNGATGCMSISPPVFISEEEAREIIFNELAKENIIFDTTDTPEITFSAQPIGESCYGHKDYDDTEITLKTDAYQKKLNLALTYISRDDILKFREGFKNGETCLSSVQEYPTKQAAEILRSKLDSFGKYNAVVFYDPVWPEEPDCDGTSKSLKEFSNKIKEFSNIESSKQKAEQLLLAQVVDFIQWLKDEKILEED